MASFVREVLSATGRLGEKEDYSGKASRLRSSIDDLKDGLRSRIEERYSDFSASAADVSQQIAQLEKVLSEVDALDNSIQHHLKPGLAEAGRESGEILRQMKELSASARAANHIRKVYEMMESANKLVEQRHYTEACKTLKKVEDAVKQDTSDQDEDTVKAFRSIKVELQTAQENVRFVLCHEWDQLVRIENMNQPPEPELKRITLGMEDGQANLANLVQAMNSSDSLSYRMNKFGAKLMSDIVQPILTRKVSSLDVFDDQEHFLELKLEPTCSGTPQPINVLKNLDQLFRFLGETFDIPVSETDQNKTLVECLGEVFGSRFKDALIKECLGPAVPSSKDGLSNYSDIIQATENLQSVMIASKFFVVDSTSSSTTDILKYAQNVDSTFANKRCQTILVQGRELMKEDLHLAATVEYTPALSQRVLEETVLSHSIDPNIEDDMLPLPKGMSLDKSVFQFPKCQVSQSTFKIKELIKETLEEACADDTTPFYSGRLLITARNLVEMYCDVVPVFHSESLKQFPQLSALAYNNFFYLGHECLTLGLTCADRLKPPFNSRAVTFADLTPKLRQTGVDIFLLQMRRQRDDLRAVLKDSSTGFGQLTGSDLLPAQSEKSIRQVLHQLGHLRRLWQDVLPLNVYCKSIGTILNTVIDDLIQKVIPLEDIAADAATQLCSFFTTLQDKGPEIFVLDNQPDSSRGDVIRYVRKWNKFNELILILNASLREIEDRWAGGKGPLAVEFSPEEVKRLIRALFQNSDRRAGVLSRIKFES